ncbi:MAG: hypothetical protein COS08_02950 [Euryarchaeota archaeon CG01_land_8_20_14_3_00_38_12]|nr:MAG: hypothetical protein COS08_02950 [Euryarchaeota archaeon CG01_land_8_20_14_3_00_38_12]PJB21373.1 MAG: hypothetical protein CO114_05680 [Euryarchaeota archaeon CG_4_9_14_3_um_filter_38_12]
MNRYKIASVLVIMIIALSICINMGTEKSTAASSIDSIVAYEAMIIPAIDGIKSPGEWDDTKFYTYTWAEDKQNITEGVLTIRISFKYNETLLFVLSEINEDDNPKTLNWGLLGLFFDSDNDVFNKSIDHVGLCWNSSYSAYTLYIGQDGSVFDSNATPSYHPFEPVNCTYNNSLWTMEATININRLNISSSKLNIFYHDGYECASVVNITQPSEYIPFIFNHPPMPIISSPENNGVYFAEENIYFDGANSSDPDDDSLSFYWHSNISGYLSSDSSFTTSLEEGVHHITLWVNDNSGHNVSTSVDITIIKANQKPIIAISTPSDGSTVKGKITIAGAANDPDGIVVGVEVKVDNGIWMGADGTWSWSYSWDTTKVKNGEHTISVRAYDGYNYSTVETVSVNVNNKKETPNGFIPGFEATAIIMMIGICILLLKHQKIKLRRKA